VGSYRASLSRHAHLRQRELAGEHGSPDTKKVGQAKRFSVGFQDRDPRDPFFTDIDYGSLSRLIHETGHYFTV